MSNVNKDSIKAKFDNGVLNIELPKKELTANNSTQILIE
ncbi:Hsp20 family protein [Clostridium saudiense]